MSDTRARRVAVEFDVVGANHNEIVARAEEVWRRYLQDDAAELPFDTEINATVDETTSVDGKAVSMTWRATVVIRQRGSSR